MAPRKRGITKATMARASGMERRATKDLQTGKFGDSFQNFGLNLGMGTNNALSGSTYGFNPITRNRTLLEWIHRGSWLGKMVVNTVADDMVRAGIHIQCDADPKDIAGVQQDLVSTGTWEGMRDSSAWARLYGGSIGVIQIDGQDYSTPLDPDRIGRGSYRGVVALDRWLVEPSLGDLCAEAGPDLGMPNYYRVTSDYPGLRMKIIHRSRCIRFCGDKLPYWQQVSENLWGASVIEALYDRMVAFDSATQGAAQAAYKSYLRVIKLKNLRQLIAAGGDALKVVYEFVNMMRMFQGIEGITMLDADDEFEPHGGVNFSGLSDVILQLGQQISGATQIPLVRLFGQSPAGLNSTGESDLRTYYDGIAQKQNSMMLVGMKKIVRAAALSGGWNIGDDFKISFQPLWQLTEEQKSEVSSTDTASVISAEQSGLVTQKTALKELKQGSKVTGRWSNITDEEIEQASDELAPRGQDAVDQEREGLEHRAEILGDDPREPREPREPRTRDGLLVHLNRSRGSTGAACGAQDEGYNYVVSAEKFRQSGNTCKNCQNIYLQRRNAQRAKEGKPPVANWNDEASTLTVNPFNKLPKAFVQYERSIDDNTCGCCAHFLKRGACELVAGPIDQAYWCKLWTTEAGDEFLFRDSLPVSEICGLPIAIECVRGSIRRGTSDDGHRWETVMPADYGYIRRAPSAEGETEWLDCFVGEDRSGQTPCFVIDGYEPLGRFDEHKVMLGFPDRAAALKCYHDAYNDGRRAGDVTEMTSAELVSWFTNGDVTRPVGKRNLRLAANGAV